MNLPHLLRVTFIKTSLFHETYDSKKNKKKLSDVAKMMKFITYVDLDEVLNRLVLYHLPFR